MELRYERIAQFVALSAVGSIDDYTAIHSVEGSIRIKFSEYVKSQIHLNVVYGLYGRSLHDYVETLYFLNGKTSKRKSAMKVLHYFYKDAANFLINNRKNVQLELVVDTENFNLSRQVVNVSQLRTDLLQGFDDVLSGKKPLIEWEYASDLDSIEDTNDLKQKADSYALAFKLQKEYTNDVTKIIESE